jgi:hypothetical protein
MCCASGCSPIALRQNDNPVTFLRAIAASHMPG